jgi:hypothetical protein
VHHRLGADNLRRGRLIDNGDFGIHDMLPDAFDGDLPETAGTENPEPTVTMAQALILVIMHGFW